MFFTDKMPENCRSCPCADGEYSVCNLDYDVALHADDRPKECPLQEVRRGKWICESHKVENMPNWNKWYCSECKVVVKKGWSTETDGMKPTMLYCGECGAKMDEKE